MKWLLTIFIPVLLVSSAVGVVAWMSCVDNSVVEICAEYHIGNGMNKHDAVLYCKGI